MATLFLHLPGSPPTPFPILKPLVSVGASADSDGRVPHMRGVVAVQFDGRNFQQQDIEDAVERLSDSIVRRALDTKEPVIVSDAIHDEQFNASESVVNLKLASVMCVPLLLRGVVSGAVYVGNDRLASLFTPRELLLMTSFCSTATLLLEHAKTLDELRADKAELQSRLDAQAYGDIIGACEAMRDIFRKIDKVAAANIDALVTGESGTGYVLIARERHRRSPRRDGPFI